MTKWSKIPPQEKSIKLLFIISWVTYFSLNLGRLNFSAALSEMVSQGFNKTNLGAVAAAFFFTYGAGQVVSGLLGDKFPPQHLVFFGLIGCGMSNLLFSAANNMLIMGLLWVINGASQAFIWSPMVKLIADRTTGNQCRKIVLFLSTTGPAGMLCSYGLSAWLIKLSGWQACFWPIGIWVLVVSAIWFVGVRIVTKYAKGNDNASSVPLETVKAVDSPPRLRILIVGLAGVILVSFLHGMIKDGLNTWVPTYLTEEFSLASSQSILLTMVLPVVNLSGVWLANTLNQRKGKNELLSAVYFFCMALAAILLIILFDTYAVIITVLLFAVVSTAMTAINTLLISLVPIRFRKINLVSTVSGILNSATYVGSALSSLFLGNVADIYGWSGVLIVLGVLVVAGIFSCVYYKKRWLNIFTLKTKRS